MTTSLLRHFPIETDKKAANLLRVKANWKTKRLRHNGFARSSQIHPSGLIPFPFGFPLFPHCLSAFFFSVFSFGKMLFRAGGVKKDKLK